MMPAVPMADPTRLERIGIHAHALELITPQRRHGASPGDDHLDLLVARHAAGDIVDQFRQQHARRQFVHAGLVDVTGNPVEQRTRMLLGADRREPLRTPLENERHVRDGLDIVDRGRTAPESVLRREGRLDAGIGTLAFDRVHQRRLLAADVRAGAAVHVDVHRKSEPKVSFIRSPT
jgi:hypothetical protein